MHTIAVALATVNVGLSTALLAHAVLQLGLARCYLGARKRPSLGMARRDGRPRWPTVTIQLPIYNEKYVVGRLLDRVMQLRWPKDRLEVQVLDDSTDETVAIVAEKVCQYRSVGFDIRHLRRATREGFKAGALRHGLAVAKGAFVAVFDADFLPHPDFLTATMPWFDDSTVGAVQT